MPNCSNSGVSLVYSLMRRTSEGWKRLAKRMTRSYSSSVSTQICENVGVDLVAQDALHQVEVVIDQRRRLAGFGAGLDLGPQMLQEADVGAQLVFLDVGGGGADDEAAQTVLALAGNDALQALALFVGVDLARDADMIDRRHVDQEAARQRDVAGDARALLADGLLGNLDQDFLAFLQQIGDQRL